MRLSIAWDAPHMRSYNVKFEFKFPIPQCKFYSMIITGNGVLTLCSCQISATFQSLSYHIRVHKLFKKSESENEFYAQGFVCHNAFCTKSHREQSVPTIAFWELRLKILTNSIF